jgi:quinol monooxygenase YgiN
MANEDMRHGRCRGSFKMSDFEQSVVIGVDAERVHEIAAKRADAWWTTNAIINDREGGYCEFRFPAGGFHAAFRVMANTPKLVEWTCVDSEHPKSSGFKDLREWVGTTVRFVIEPLGDRRTRLTFRHSGLVESLECFDSCSNIWGFYLHSLKKLAETGTGDPFAGGRPGTRTEGLVALMVPFRVRPDKAAVAEAAIGLFIDHIESNEPDTLIYRSYRDANDPLSYVHYMAFRDGDAHARHFDSACCADFVKALYPCCEKTPAPVSLGLFREAALGSRFG